MGDQLLSLKPDRWRGQSSLNVTDRGERRWLKIENGYVSHDGSEIRQWPGSFTMLDLSAANNANGYDRYVTDAVLPIFSTTPTEVYQFESVTPASNLLTLRARAKPQHLHCFEQIADQVLVVGESRFTECPVFDSGRNVLTVTAVENSGGLIRLTLSGTPAARTSADTGAGMNGLYEDDVVYVEGITLTAPAGGEQAGVDGKLNRRVHQINVGGIVGATVTLQTTSIAALLALRACTGGQIHVVRFNRTNTYDNANGLSPYNSDPNLRIDDPTSLSCWRVVDGIEPKDSQKDCLPAWVANRQRDFSDARSSGPAAAPTEGVWVSGLGTRGVARREKLAIPYRVGPEPATDRLVLAAPGYGCLFQIPARIPADFTGANGVPFYCNDLNDKPRSLGVPKARMVECFFKTTPANPAQWNNGTTDFMAKPFVAAPANGLPAGDYQVAISYEDDATGEEGLASESVTVTIPAASPYAWTIVIAYLHPGYVMGECLATKVNVYIAPPNEEAMAFYASFPLSKLPVTAATVNNTNRDLSAKYGFEGNVASTVNNLYRTIELPLPGDTSDLSGYLDAERLAPQSAGMPRGAETARYVRGVLFSGGCLGNTGGGLQLWASKASSTFGVSSYMETDQVQIRSHGDTSAVPIASMDGDLTNHTIGIAGRCFPSAYQGIELVQREMLPDRATHRIDRVLNRMCETLTGAQYYYMHHERLRLTRDVWSRTRVTTVVPPTISTASRTNKDVWYLMPRGQLTISDPGAPGRASTALIQFVDANRGDDISGIGSIAGSVVICSRRETYSFAWHRSPGAELPNLMSNEFGCIASNSMVSFDGGLAWLSERGPVALGGAGVQHIGADVESSFGEAERRYQFDSRGMMRHAWSAHDGKRGLVMWGMVTKSATHTVESEFAAYTWDTASDEIKSRFPCDEVLVWSYRANAFSTWRPPAGQEVLWMRPLRDVNGEIWMCYLAADGRIYALDDAAHDTNHRDAPCEFALTTVGRSTTTLAWSGSPTTGKDGDADPCRDGNLHLRAGMTVEFINAKGEMTASRTIASIQTTGATTSLTLSASTSWEVGSTVRIGTRQSMTLISTYVGAETKANLNVSNVHVRYTLFGEGTANMKGALLKSDFIEAGPAAREVSITDADAWTPMGNAEEGQTGSNVDGYRVSHRRVTCKGGASSAETAVKLVVTGTSQVRIADISLEV